MNVEGTIISLDPADGLGWIESTTGERVRFGGTACKGFVPQVGLRVLIVAAGPGHGGVTKASELRVADGQAAAAPQPAPQTRPARVGPYTFHLPDWFAEPELHTQEGFAISKSAATRDITFDIYVAGGGDIGIDGYFGSLLRRFEDGRARGFDLDHLGLSFRGWYIDESATLSPTPGSFLQTYGTVANGDAVCFTWASFGAPPTDGRFEQLFLSIVYSGLVTSKP